MSPVTFPRRPRPPWRYPPAVGLSPDGSLFWGGSPNARGYRLFAIVEGASSLARYQRPFGPDGEPIEIRWPIGEDRVHIVSLCGFGADRFESEMSHFQDLSIGKPSDEQRQQRRKDLQSRFHDDRTPCLHAVFPGSLLQNESTRFLLAPGQWLELVLMPDAEEAPGPEVHLDQPLMDGDDLTLMRLVSMAAPAAQTRARLADVFSLAHVPDATFLRKEDGRGIVTPRPPDPAPLADARSLDEPAAPKADEVKHPGPARVTGATGAES